MRRAPGGRIHRVARRLDRERGATVIIIALAGMVLFGFVALVVDVGMGFNERRQDQSAADVGSLAAVQFARPSPGSSSISQAMINGANEAIAVAAGTLDDPLLADWTTCTDPGRPAEYTLISPVTQCVSYVNNLQKARVHLPLITRQTSFARLLGVEVLTTSALAEAKGSQAAPGRILPFALPTSAAGASHICLKTGPNPNNVTPCDGPDSGNFGSLDISLYSNLDLYTPQICGDSQTNLKLHANIAIGADHDLVLYTGPDVRNDHDGCPIIFYYPNEIPGQTGVGSNLDDGLRWPIYGSNGRLARGAYTTNIVNGTPWLDDTPLWDYLDDTALRPDSCGYGLNPNPANRVQMEQCLADWKTMGPYSDPLFSPDIGDAVRFAAVPELFVDLGPGSVDYRIKDFRPVYIQTTYWKCNANTCTIVFEPGEAPLPGNCPSPTPTTSCGFPAGGGGNTEIEAMTAFLLTVDMLPQSVRDTLPGAPTLVPSYALTR